MRSQIATAVVSELNGQAAYFVPATFTAVRAHMPLEDLADLKTLHVTVVTRSFSQELSSRADIQTEIEVDVAVQHKVAPEDNTPMDALNTLVERIIKFFERRVLSGYEQAIWTKTENALLYIPEHLKKRLFTSVITLTYRLCAE